MKKLARHTGLLLILVLALAAPAAAQDNDSAAQLEFVVEAFENFAALSSYTISGEQVVDQEMTIPGQGTMQTYIESTLFYQIGQTDGQMTQLKGEMSMATEYSGDAFDEPMALTMRMQYRLVDEVYYIRYEMNYPGMENVFPDEWLSFSLSEFTDLMQDVPGMESLDLSALMELTGNQNAQMLMPITAENLISLTELEGETLDGQPMRVFEIELDYADMLNMAGLEGITALVPSEIDLTELAETIPFIQTVWIGADDQLPYRVVMAADYDMSDFFTQMMGGDMQTEMVQTMNSDMVLGDFDAPFEVEAPASSISFTKYFGTLGLTG